MDKFGRKTYMQENLLSTFSPRQYMLDKDFELYYYSDTEMQNVKDHTHNYYEFYFFFDGKVSIYIENDEYLLSSGDMIIIPPGTKHHLNIIDNSIPYQRCILWISQDYCEHLLNVSKDLVYPMQRAAVTKKNIYHFDVFTFNELKVQMFRLIREMRGNRFGRTIRIALSIHDFIFTISRNVYEIDNHEQMHEQNTLYDNILLYIDDHITENLTLDSIADAFFISKYHISHVFTENSSISLHQYIIKKRLNLCVNAIVSGTDISEAYLLCGFKDYSSFYRAFKKEYGMSPRDYVFSQKSL